MMKRFYFAKTSDENLLKDGKQKLSDYTKTNLGMYLRKEHVPKKLRNTSFLKEIENNKVIRFKFIDKFLLLIHDKLPFVNYISCWSKKK